MKVNAENFLLDNGSLATKENIFFITGNDDSVIKQVEKKLIEKAEISDTFEIYKTDQASIMVPDDLVDSQGSIFNETKACIHNSPKELNIDIFKNFEKVSLPIIINSPKTKAGTKVKNFFDRHENFLSISCYQITRDFKQKNNSKFFFK